MGFEADFLDLFSSVVSYKSFSSDSGYGDPAFAAPLANIPAFLKLDNKIVRGDREDTVNSSAQIIIPPPGYVTPGGVTIPTVIAEDHFVLPGSLGERRVLEVTVHYDDFGVHHQSVMLT